MTNGQLGYAVPTLSEGACPPAAKELTDGQLLNRFIAHHDQAAFTALVHRHGPMVLVVCRRVLRDWHDAEDAFQATFLILVRKARAIGRPELLANWLYGVAYRTALKAKAKAFRRGERERQGAQMRIADLCAEEPTDDLEGLLDEELQRLPDKYRAPLVLCYLEGKTNEQAARELGWPAGSISGRLARGREMLRNRLNRRGRTMTPAIFPLMLAPYAATGIVPAMLLNATVRAAGLSAAGKAVAGTVSAAAAALAESILQAMWLRRLKWAAAGFLAVLLLAAGASYACFALQATGSQQAPPRSCEPYSDPCNSVPQPP
jgi:RNA polymerase sigma factor (sigma-70 family)